MKTFDIGPLFFHPIKLASRSPLINLGNTQEISAPFRNSTSLIVRPPLIPWGLAFGWWRSSGMTEEEALLSAVSGWGLNPYEDDEYSDDVKQTIRENIASAGMDLDDEWKVISALGVADAP